MLSCQLMGGLGNQLFQIFTIISYSIEFNHSYFFFNEEYTIGCTKRITYWNTLLNKVVLFNKEKNVNFHLILKEDPEYTTKTILDFPIDKNILLYGYFQSYKYFHSHYNKIYELLEIEKKKQEVLSKCVYYNKLFLNSCCSIHFRIGDYLQLQDYHNILTLDYYKNALLKVNVSFVLYFCEEKDKKRVKKMITLLRLLFPSIFFYKIHSSFSDWEQLLIMSLCKDNIIANSTFSWWGSYFNSNKDKIVCYPKQWYGPKKNVSTKDLFPTNWVVV